MIVLQAPQKTITGTTNLSRWNAVHNPLIFGFQRSDLIVTSVARYRVFVGGVWIEKISATLSTPVPAGLTNTSYIYLSAGVYKGLYQVWEAVSGSYNIALNTPNKGDAGAGFINTTTKINYRVEVKVLNFYDALSQIGSNILNRSDISGLVKCDLSAWLKTKVVCKDDFDHSVINKRDYAMGGAFNIEYRELYDGYTGAWVADINTYFFTNSAKQHGELYGANMGEYVPGLITNNNTTVLPLRPIYSFWNVATYNNATWVENPSNSLGVKFTGDSIGGSAGGNVIISKPAYLTVGQTYTILVSVSNNNNTRIAWQGTTVVPAGGSGTFSLTLVANSTSLELNTINATNQTVGSTASADVNLIEITQSVATGTASKFLSDFKKPTYYPGYPFDLSFIYSDILNYKLNRVEVSKNINGGDISTVATEIDETEKKHINRLIITAPVIDVKEVDLYLTTGSAATNNYVADDYVADDYFETQ